MSVEWKKIILLNLGGLILKITVRTIRLIKKIKLISNISRINKIRIVILNDLLIGIFLSLIFTFFLKEYQYQLFFSMISLFFVSFLLCFFRCRSYFRTGVACWVSWYQRAWKPHPKIWFCYLTCKGPQASCRVGDLRAFQWDCMIAKVIRVSYQFHLVK